MDMICYTCGHRGCAHALVVCNECEGFAVHRYCMAKFDLTEEITWSCEYCEVNTNLVEQCSSIIEGGGERGTSPTTSLCSDSQNLSRMRLMENPGVEVDRKRKMEETHHLDNKKKHATVVKTELLLEGDGNKVDCDKQLNIAEKEASGGKAACEENWVHSNVQTDGVVPIDQHASLEETKIPSCCAEIQAGQPEQNVAHVTGEPAENATLLLKGEVRSMPRHDHTQGTDHQCSVLRMSTKHESLVDRPNVVENSLDPVSCKTIQSTTLGFSRVDEKEKSTPTGDTQLNRSNSGLVAAADVFSECGRNKPNKGDKNAKFGDAHIDGMIQRFSPKGPKQPIPPAIVQSVHRPQDARTLPDQRNCRAHGSARSLPLHRVHRSTEQEARVPRYRRNDTLQATVEKVHHGSRFSQRRLDVPPKGLDSIPEFQDRSNGGTRGNSKDLFQRQGFGPKIHNFRYIPAHCLFDFVWQGSFKIGGAHCIQLTGHTSSTRHIKGNSRSRFLPRTGAISLDMISCPLKVDMTTLRGHHVDLFFFPPDSRAQEMVDGVLQDMENRNVVLKANIDNTELSILSSFIFPEPSRKFQGKCYLWGMFSSASDNRHL